MEHITKTRMILTWGLMLGASVAGVAQTKVDLQQQAKNVDFSAAGSTKPVKTGAVLPGTCTIGEMFFNSAAVAGSNLYACTALNTWTLQSGGGSSVAAQLPGDLEVTLSSGTYRIGSGQARYGNIATVFNPATLQVVSGTDSGTVRFFVDFNTGNPVLRCMLPGSFSGTYTAVGMSCITGNGYPVDALPLGEASVIAGAGQIPVDRRAWLQGGPTPQAGAGLVSSHTGQAVTLSVNTAEISHKFIGAGAPGSVANSTLGDLYFDTANGKAYACFNALAACSGVLAGQWVLLN
jgi:hypothetical protein